MTYSGIYLCESRTRDANSYVNENAVLVMEDAAAVAKVQIKFKEFDEVFESLEQGKRYKVTVEEVS